MSYPIEIEIDEPHTEVIDEILTDVESAIMDIRDRWQKTDDRIVHTANLDHLLAEHQAIAIVWDIQHVKDQRPDLRDEQAWEVLQDCQQCFNRLRDAMRETILDAAGNRYPQQSQARHAKAAEIIARYGNGNERENLVDLLTDAMLWCEGMGERFDEFCDTARRHFAAECMGDTIKPEGE